MSSGWRPNFASFEVFSYIWHPNQDAYRVAKERGARR
jgi:hypothetical protein